MSISSTGPAKTLSAVIFDMDGLMIDSESLYWAAGREVARRYGTMVKDQTLGRMMGRSPVDSMRVFGEELQLSESPQRSWNCATELWSSQCGREYRHAGTVRGAERPRKVIQARCRHQHTQRFADTILASLGILDRFACVQTSDDIVNGKPDPEIYLKAMARLAVPPGQCVVLEDSSNGAALESGRGPTRLPCHRNTRDQDFSFVDYTAANLSDAVRHIKATFASGE